MDSCDLSKSRDPTIKLFGRKIEIPTKPKSTEIVNGLTKPDGCSSLLSAKEEHKVSGDPIGVVVNCKSKEEKSEAYGIEQDKVFKKPDKILPCPRCNSSDTKFCYFNNYNVNQPRHFCKNCQRYWTAGGTMRNVPVGAGRRKNKQFASQYRQILASSDGEPISKIETADSDNNQVVSSVGNGTVLKFGSEAPLCESMDTVLQLGDQKNVTAMTSAVNNREHVHEQELSVRGSSAMVTSGSWSSNVPAKVLRKEQASLPSSCNDVTPQSSLPFYPVLPWSFPLNPGWNSVSAVVTDGGNVNPVQFCLAPMLEIPGRFPPNIPSSNLACTPILGHSSFSTPYGNAVSPIFPSDNSYCLESDGSQTLGKHPRDPTSTEEIQMRKYILVPKMLRINDEDTASKSPIWATFGVIPDQAACLLKNPGFKGLQPESESPHIREANPAALSRSHTFQECT